MSAPNWKGVVMLAVNVRLLVAQLVRWHMQTRSHGIFLRDLGNAAGTANMQ